MKSLTIAAARALAPLLLAMSAPVFADPLSDLRAELEALKASNALRIEQLEQRIAQLEASAATAGFKPVQETRHLDCCPRAASQPAANNAPPSVGLIAEARLRGTEVTLAAAARWQQAARCAAAPGLA